MKDDGYLLTNTADEAGARFRAFAALFDPSTFRHMDDLGLAPGWRCWEVGAGGTSVLDHLAAKVGPTGHVLATDLNTEWAAGAAIHPNTEVLVHNAALDPPPDDSFDLVHARLVLVHIRERSLALSNLVATLRPGGWLFIEDADPGLQPLSCPDVLGPNEELANRLRTGFRTLMAGRGADMAYGRTLPRLLRAAGLTDVVADAAFPVSHPACADLEVATISLIREQLVSHAIATNSEIDRHLANVASGTLGLTQPPMISCWGRRPF